MLRGDKKKLPNDVVLQQLRLSLVPVGLGIEKFRGFFFQNLKNLAKIVEHHVVLSFSLVF
jgi:hypothetical protein